MFWFFYGLIVGAGGMKFIDWTREEHIRVDWYVWLLAGGALVLGTLALQHFLASYQELERKAAWVGLASLGIPAVILAAAAAWLLRLA